ncbi:hypothetical protein BGW38_008151, partial [Lunasporangiospora selenospora]
MLDHVILPDNDGGLFVLDHPQEVKDEVLRYFRDEWHAPRRLQPLEENPFWEAKYRPREDIDEAWFQEIMAIPSDKELEKA